MLDLIERLLPKNRTIVTSDAHVCMEEIAARYPIEVLRYKTGSEYQTWPVPPEWNVVRASVTDGANTIAGYDESALFLAPYSTSFRGWVNREQLIAHTFTNPAQPDAYCYEFRLAYNYQRRLKEWRISMPHERVEALKADRYYVDIEVDTRPGEMLIGESVHHGSSGFAFNLLSHYCHVGQVNDGIAGVVAVLEALARIRTKFASPRHTYRALAMPETIGSSIYAATHLEDCDKSLGAAFSEMAAADAPVQLVMSRRGNTYIDRVFLHVLHQRGLLPCRSVPFRRGWGNDELVFDAPGVGVPAVSLDRYPFSAYHTHHDNLDNVSVDCLEEMVELFVDVASVLEADFIPRPTNRVPTYLTRYDLYADWTYQRDQYDLNTLMLDEMWSGRSVLDIALQNGIDVEMVQKYIQRFVDAGLVAEEPVTPHYSRNHLFLQNYEKEQK